MKGKSVFVLMYTEPDGVSVSVYEKEEDAIEALKELAEENDMECGSHEAYGDESFASIEEVEIL